VNNQRIIECDCSSKFKELPNTISNMVFMHASQYMTIVMTDSSIKEKN
jgi:hypothetical protein